MVYWELWQKASITRKKNVACLLQDQFYYIQMLALSIMHIIWFYFDVNRVAVFFNNASLYLNVYSLFCRYCMLSIWRGTVYDDIAHDTPWIKVEYRRPSAVEVKTSVIDYIPLFHVAVTIFPSLNLDDGLAKLF